jgi:hypothetical protein
MIGYDNAVFKIEWQRRDSIRILEIFIMCIGLLLVLFERAIVFVQYNFEVIFSLRNAKAIDILIYFCNYFYHRTE